MRGKVNVLPDEIKLLVVQEYLGGGITQNELMIKYNFRGKNCINNWIRKFGVDYSTKKQPVVKNSKQAKSDNSLELKFKKLEEELKREQLKNMALDTMIDIAERELKIDIRKKRGAKR